MVYSDDPQWPALKLEATLPKLTLHFNESKIQTSRSVISAFFGNDHVAAGVPEKLSLSHLSDSQINLHEAEADRKMEGANPTLATQIMAQFTIQTVSVDIQTQGRSIAELQVVGARTIISKNSVDTGVLFVIQNMLLADAIQTFGPDFQLLLASHRHVWYVIMYCETIRVYILCDCDWRILCALIYFQHGYY